MKKAIFYEFGEVNVFNNFVVAIMKEGITVIPEYNDVLIDISEKYFKGKSFGYITYRKNSYAVDPMIYLKTSEIKNLVAFAIVSVEGSLKETNVILEKRFLKKPFKHFHNIDEAKNWVNEIISQTSASQ